MNYTLKWVNFVVHKLQLNKAIFKIYSVIDDLTMSFEYSYIDGTVVYTYINKNKSSYIYFIRL